MIDINKLRNAYENTCKKIKNRKRVYHQLDEFLIVDKKWKETINKLQTLNTKRNELSSKISILLKENKIDEIEKIKKQVKEMKINIDELNNSQNAMSLQLNEILYSLPNIPDDDVPVGFDENDNVLVRTWKDIPNFSFTPKTHWELSKSLNLADFEKGAKLSGSRHTILIGDGAKLMRALRNFTLDFHVSNGFVEIQPPILINPNILYGTGHLPKAKEDMYEITNQQFLSPTEEVPLTGMYNNEIIDINQLPIKLTSSTVSFRSEAGSAGKDMRGFIRQHQFYNTEMVIFSLPEESENELEKMTNQCEKILQLLGLPYRVILLCTGDMGSAAVKTYDVEVWFPCNNKYREISSCSNCREYQARGSMIKYRNNNKTEFLHTLNGTGTSLNRLWIAIIENYQQPDGTIKIPDVLIPYMNNQDMIK